MNEKQRYQNAFNEIPDNYNIDLNKIRVSKKPAKIKASGIIMAMLVLLSVSFTTVYAVNEDFRSDFTMWITGKRTTAELTKIDDHHYKVLLTLPDGNQVSRNAVGDPAGPPLDPDQLIEHYINLWEIAKNEQGRVIFYYQNKMRDITDRFKPLGVSVEMIDDNQDGEMLEAVASEYCYYEFSGRYYWIVHVVSPEKGIDQYTSGMSLDSFTQGGIGGYTLPPYEEYAGEQKYYEEPQRMTIGTREYVVYKYLREDITDRMIPWGYEEDGPWELEDGTVENCHYVYESYCYFKMNDMYITVFNLAQTFSGDLNEMDVKGINCDTKGYLPIMTESGETPPVPEGELISPESNVWLR